MKKYYRARGTHPNQFDGVEDLDRASGDALSEVEITQKHVLEYCGIETKVEERAKGRHLQPDYVLSFVKLVKN